MRKRVASPAARKAASAWGRDRPGIGALVWGSPDIKICLYVLGLLGKAALASSRTRSLAIYLFDG